MHVADVEAIRNFNRRTRNVHGRKVQSMMKENDLQDQRLQIRADYVTRKKKTKTMRR